MAFTVDAATKLNGFSSSTLPEMDITIRDAETVCEGDLEFLTDEEVAGVLTYVRNTFGNDARPVMPETVKRVSDAIQARGMFYMVDQLMKEQPFEAGEKARNVNPRKQKREP